MTFWKWSTIAANNASADSTCPFPEGMAASALNDGTRGMMAAAAKYRDDVSGILLAGGTSAALTLATNQVQSSTPAAGLEACFRANFNVAAGATLALDGGLAFPIQVTPGAPITDGVLIGGTPYSLLFNGNTWLVRGLHGNPYNIPLGAGIDYWGSAAPNSAFAFPVGQGLSTTVYASLFALLGYTFGGAGGTFSLPDKRGRVSAAVDNMGGVAAGRFTPGFGTALGEQNHTLVASEIPAHTHSGTTGVDSPDHTHAYNQAGALLAPGNYAGGTDRNIGQTATNSGGASARHAHAFTTDGGAGLAGASHNVTQPTIVCNYIMRII